MSGPGRAVAGSGPLTLFCPGNPFGKERSERIVQKKDIGLGIVSIVFGIWVFAVASGLKSGPDFWPKLVAIGIIILGAIILVMALIHLKKGGESEKKEEKKPKAKPQYLKVLAVIIVLVIYYFAFQYIGYTIPTFLLIAVTSYILGYRNWKVMIPSSLIVSVCLYLAFSQLFGINFPGVFF